MSVTQPVRLFPAEPSRAAASDADALVLREFFVRALNQKSFYVTITHIHGDPSAD
jgi:hypothetical protein